MKYKLNNKLTAITAVLIGIYSIIGIFFLKWDINILIISYLLELLLIGIFASIKMYIQNKSCKKRGLSVHPTMTSLQLFLVFLGFSVTVVLVYFVFILFLILVKTGSAPELIFNMGFILHLLSLTKQLSIILILNQLFHFIVFVLLKQYEHETSFYKPGSDFFLKGIPVHIMVIFGFIFNAGILLIILKTFFEGFFFNLSRKEIPSDTEIIKDDYTSNVNVE